MDPDRAETPLARPTDSLGENMTTNPPNVPGSHSPVQKSAGRDVLSFVKRFWLPIVLLILAIIFIATNTNSYDFTIGWIHVNAPMWLMTVILVLVGFIIGWFVGRRGKND